MDFVVARLKRLRRNPYRKLISDSRLFPVFNTGDVQLVQFSPAHNLDEDSWFVIDDFSTQRFFINKLGESLDSKNFNDMDRGQFQDINCLLSIQNGSVYFQKVTPSSFIKKKFLKLGEAVEVETGQSRIVIKEQPDAIFLKNEDKLLFREIATVSSIFVGIDQLYKEATQQDVRNFLHQEFLVLDNNFNANSVSKPNRKRLALAMDTMARMSQGQKDDLVKYIHEYCGDKVTLTDDGKQLSVSSDIQLKFILYGIEERFYTTHHGKEKRLANSVEVMTGQS